MGLYNSGFDPRPARCRPGVVLIARTIEDAIARGFRRYDFLRGEEPYKYGFGAVPTEVLRVTLDGHEPGLVAATGGPGSRCSRSTPARSPRSAARRRAG